MLEFIHHYADMIIFVLIMAIIFICIHIQYIILEKERSE